MPPECTRFMINLMNQWKSGFTVYASCIVLGLGVVLIYCISGNNSTDNNSSQPPDELDEALPQAELSEEYNYIQALSEQFYGSIILGNYSLEMGFYEDAVAYYTNYLSMGPQSDRLLIAHVIQSRAITYYKMKLLNECLADCDKVLEFLPINKDTLFLRAKVLVNMKNFKLAAEDVTVYLLTKGNEDQIEDVSRARLVIMTFDDETIKEFRVTKNSMLLLIKQIKQITNYKESFLDETLNAVDPKVLDKEEFKTNTMTAIQFLGRAMDKYSADTTRSDPSEVIKLKNSIDLRLEAVKRLKYIPETNETSQ